MICTKFDWNWPAGSGEDFFFNINICKYGFPYCDPSRSRGTMNGKNLNLHYIRKLLFEEDLTLNLNNLEFPIPMDDLYQVWLKLACWFWKRFLFRPSVHLSVRPSVRPSVHKVFSAMYAAIPLKLSSWLYMYNLQIKFEDGCYRPIFRRAMPLEGFYSFPDFFFALLTDIHLIFGTLLCHTKI
jgi:hypothetical protein